MFRIVIFTIVVFLIFLVSLTFDDIDDWFEKRFRIKRNKKLLSNLSKDKEVPKPLGSLNKGDIVYHVDLKKFRNSLMTLSGDDVDKHLADKALTEDLYIHAVNKIDRISNIYCKDGSIFSVKEDNLESYIDHNDRRVLSTSLELLSIYIKKMENDTKLDIIERVKKNESSRDGSKVSKWLDELNQKNLSLKK